MARKRCAEDAHGRRLLPAHRTGLKRKDFIASAELSDRVLSSGRFVDDVSERFKAATPFMKLLCRAVGVPY